MSKSKKPRKHYRPRCVAFNTMDVAKHHAAKPEKVDREEIISMVKTALKALREGVGTEYQWSIAAGQLAVAFAIERQGTVRGLAGHLRSIEVQLQNIYDRATRSGRWISTALYYTELDALTLLIDLYTFQLDKLSRAELLAAVADAKKQNVADGHTVEIEHYTERMAA